MKNFKFLTILFIILVLAGSVGYFLKPNKSILYFYIQPNSEIPFYEDAIKQVENLLRLPGHEVKIYSTPNELDQKDLSKKDPNSIFSIGIVSPFHYYNNKLLQDNYEVLNTASPNPFKQCFNEGKIITLKDSNINQIEQLNNKNLAIHSPAKKISLLFMHDLRTKKIKFNTIYLNKPKYWIEENLRNKKIDAVMAFSYYPKEAPEVSQLLEESRKRSNLKPIFQTNNQIPCKILIVSKQLNQEIKDKLIDRLMSSVDDSKNFIHFKDSINIGAFEKITKEELKIAQQSINNLKDAKIEDFAKYVENDEEGL